MKLLIKLKKRWKEEQEEEGARSESEWERIESFGDGRTFEGRLQAAAVGQPGAKPRRG